MASSGGFPVELLPLLAVWGVCWSIPCVVVQYVSRRHLPPIKYCQPHLIAATGVAGSLYSLTAPVAQVANAPILVKLLCDRVFPTVLGVAYLLSAGAVVLLAQITDLLTLHVNFAPNHVKRLTFYRSLLYPRTQMTILAALSLGLSLPRCIVDASLFTDYNPPLLFAVLSSCVEFAALGVGNMIAIKCIPPDADNFNLRRRYIRTTQVCAGLLILVCIYRAVLSACPDFWAIEAYQLDLLSRLVAVLAIVYINLYLPLRAAPKPSNAVDPLRTKSLQFEHYLSTPDGMAAFQTFCKRDFCTEEILAWQVVDQFKRGLVSADAVFARCLSSQGALACPISTHWSPIYKARLAARRGQDLDIVGDAAPTTFFDDFQDALGAFLLHDVWPRFQLQSPAWKSHRQRLRHMASMDSVLRMVESKRAKLRPANGSSAPNPGASF